MFYSIIFGLIVLTLIVLMLLLKVNIVIEYSKGGQNDRFVLSFFCAKKTYRVYIQKT